MRRLLPMLVGAIVLAVACKDAKQLTVTSGPTVADSADQVLFQARYLVSTNGIQRGDLTADTAYVLDDGTRIDLRKAHVNFTSAAGAPEGTMDANRGVYSTRTQILEAWGDVVVKLIDGRMLKSPHAIFNQVTHQITSDTSYTISRGTDTQHGIGFTSNQTFTSFRCLSHCGGVTSVMFPEK
jgi:LPS export ABC transporter protein LptC